MPPTIPPPRLAARLAAARRLLRRLTRRLTTLPCSRPAARSLLSFALLASSSLAIWYLLHDAEGPDEARPTVALVPAELEILQQQTGRRIDRSLHERSHTEAPERARPDETEASSPIPTHPTDRVLPVPPTPPSHDGRPVPKVIMLVRGVMGLDGAQVKVGAQTVTVGELREVLVTAGLETLRWRAHERDAWRSGGSWRFQPGTTVVAFVTTRGLELRTLP